LQARVFASSPARTDLVLAAQGLAEKGKGGEWVDRQYDRILADPDYIMPVNTHGGLLSFGAPWEAPIMFGVYEAIRQLTRTAGKQQVAGARRALVYGNGGIFSSSAVAILSRAIKWGDPK
jgi:acetyl-CoA acetyltransferase